MFAPCPLGGAFYLSSCRTLKFCTKDQIAAPQTGQTIHLSEPISFPVSRLSLNPSCALLLLQGPGHLLVVNVAGFLRTRAADRPLPAFHLPASKLAGSHLHLAAKAVSILQLEWHPLSAHGQHVAILLEADGGRYLSLYSLLGRECELLLPLVLSTEAKAPNRASSRRGFSDPVVALRQDHMQHTYLPVSCFAFGAGPATVGSSAAATAESAACASAPMSSETAATAPGQGWLPLSVFLATPAGMVYAVSPFVPRSCHMSLELLRALRASCRVSHASAEQAAWVDSLYLVEFNKFSLRSERLPSVQGPFLLSSPESTNFQPTLPTPSATSTVDAVLATPVTGDHALLTLFYGCGALHSALHLHGILPQWQTGAGEVSAHPLLAGSRADYAKLYPMRAFNFGQGAPATGQDHQFMATPLAGAEACLIFSPSSVYLLDFSPLCLGLRRFFSSLAGPVGVHATLPQALLAPENLLCRVSCLLRVFSTRQAISDCLLVRPDLGPLALRPGTDSGDCPALLVVSLHQSSGTFTTACLPFDLAKHAASGTAAPPGRVPVLVPGNEASVSDHVAYVRSLLDEIPISTRMIVDDHADEQKMQMLAETFAEAARARSLPILSYVSSMFMMIFNRIDQAKAGQTEEAELLDQAWQKLSGQNTQLQERIRQNTARAEALKSKLSALLILHLKSKSATISTAEQEHFNRLEDQSRHVEQLQLGLERLEERIGSLKGAAMAATAAQEGAGSSVPAELLAADPERAVALLFPPREGLLISEELLSLRTSIMSLKSSLSSAETRLSHLL